MVRQWQVGVVVVIGLTLAGCSPGQIWQGKQPPHATDAGVAAELPRSLAGPPVTLGLPRRLQNVQLLRATYVDGTVQLFSHAAWHGKVITLYYVPAQNVLHEGDHYDLRSTVNVQKIGQTRTHGDGTWTYDWKIGNTKVPKHQGWFFLAKSEFDEVGLLHMNTFN